VSRWTWTDTLVVAVLAWLIATGVLVWQQSRIVPVAPNPEYPIALDTVGCGHVARCVPSVRARWMSGNPVGAGE
jgi:hypothetical protein